MRDRGRHQDPPYHCRCCQMSGQRLTLQNQPTERKEAPGPGGLGNQPGFSQNWVWSLCMPLSRCSPWLYWLLLVSLNISIGSKTFSTILWLMVRIQAVTTGLFQGTKRSPDSDGSIPRALLGPFIRSVKHHIYKPSIWYMLSTGRLWVLLAEGQNRARQGRFFRGSDKKGALLPEGRVTMPGSLLTLLVSFHVNGCLCVGGSSNLILATHLLTPYHGQGQADGKTDMWETEQQGIWWTLVICLLQTAWWVCYQRQCEKTENKT